jgi:lipopolysaccharide transport system ATP-binding protein
MKNEKTIISVQKVSKKFKLFDSPKKRLMEALHPFKKVYHKEFWALNGVSFDIYEGETIGIIGRNGSGKSTLLQIICSVMQPTQGDVQVHGRISALLELGFGFNPEFTGRENVLLNGSIIGFSKEEMLKRLPEIEKFADIGEFFDRPIKLYSSGMQVRVAFAAAIQVDPKILIVDEALSVGDIKFQEKCFRKFAEFQKKGRTILFVTHSTSLVEQLCDRAMVIESGKIDYMGDPQSAVNRYEAILFPRKNKAVNEVRSEKGTSCHTEMNETSKGTAYDSHKKNVQSEKNNGILLDAFLTDWTSQDQCFLRRSYNKDELRFGDGGGEIIDYLIVRNDQEDPVAIDTGSEITIYIKVIGRNGVKKPSIGVGIFTHTGLMVCSGNARLLNRPLRQIKAGRIYIYKMSFKALMAGGHYFIHFGLTEDVSGKIVRHDARRSIAMLRVMPTPHLEGLADLSMHIEEIESFKGKDSRGILAKFN